MMESSGKSLRMRRLSRDGDGKFLFVPLDHSLSDGPVRPQRDWADLVRLIALGGADGIVVHKGRIRAITPAMAGDCAVIVQLSAGTAHAGDPNRKVLVGEVAEAIRLGADAVSVHVNMGAETEHTQLADLGAVAAACDQWNVPLLAMVYARGPKIGDGRDPAVLAHAVNVAADLGADIVKTAMTHHPAGMAEVVAQSPIPVLAAGGPVGRRDLVEDARALMRSGCGGLAAGRRVFTAPSPLDLVARLAAVVHPDSVPHPALAGLTERSDHENSLETA